MHNEKAIGCWRGWTGLGHVGHDCIEFITAINGLGCARLGGAELSGAMGEVVGCPGLHGRGSHRVEDDSI